MESIGHVNYSVIREYYQLLPLACILQSNDVDEELANLSLGLLSILSHTITIDQNVPDALSAIDLVSSCPFWSARACVAEFISVFVFHNMATLITKNEWIDQVCYLKTLPLFIIISIRFIADTKRSIKIIRG